MQWKKVIAGILMVSMIWGTGSISGYAAEVQMADTQSIETESNVDDTLSTADEALENISIEVTES
jgi:hypothetical protein